MTIENRRFTIPVSAEDIEKAIPENSSHCAIARAVARAIPEATRIKADAQAVRLTLDGTRYVYLSPQKVYEYIVAFDAGDPLEPFKFQLREPFPFVTIRKTENTKTAARARYAARKKATVEGKSGEAISEAGNEAYAASRKADGGGPVQKTMGRGSRKRTPTVIKSPNLGRERHYGHREMRINEDRFASP